MNPSWVSICRSASRVCVVHNCCTGTEGGHPGCQMSELVASQDNHLALVSSYIVFNCRRLELGLRGWQRLWIAIVIG